MLVKLKEYHSSMPPSPQQQHRNKAWRPKDFKSEEEKIETAKGNSQPTTDPSMVEGLHYSLSNWCISDIWVCFGHYFPNSVQIMLISSE